MPSTHPVPSRATLNALRGVLFTTSCSVLFLAEERRRRLKIARAAIDNARKLHTVRSNRGPIALTEGWEGRLSELDHEVISIPPGPRPKTSYRRRRRSDSLNYLLYDGELEVHKNPIDLDDPKRNNQATTGPQPSLQTETVGVGIDSIKPVPSTGYPWHDPFESLAVSASTGIPSRMAISGSSNGQEVKSFGHQRRHPILNSMGTPLHVFHGPSTDESDPTGIEHFLSGLLSLSSISHYDIPSQVPWYETAKALEQMLRELGTKDEDRSKLPDQIEKAISTLRSLGEFHPTSPKLDKVLTTHGIELLKATAQINHTEINTILSIVLPKCKDPILLISPFAGWLQEKNDRQGMKQLLVSLADLEQSRFWRRGMTVHRLLSHQIEAFGFKQTKHLYLLLQTIGLYDTIAVSHETEYRIRRLMISNSLSAGDDTFAQQEIKSISELDLDAFKVDVKLQSRLVVRQAALGNWDSVQDGVQTLLGIADANTADFQSMLGKITDTFAQTYSPQELEALLRKFVCDYSIALKSRWITLILDDYASSHNLEAMFSWLQFCVDHRFRIDDAFIQRFYTSSRRYWSFSDKSLATLHETVQETVLNIPSEGSANGLGTTPLTSLETGNWVTESDALKYLELLASRGEWEQICSAYSEYLLTNPKFSAQCLRLAVLGHLRKQGGSIEQAASLINEARGQGHDVTVALTPLLLARIEKGDDASDLVKEELRRGIRIHDSVYNKAAQMLSAKGDLREATRMCETAARENGNGELLYNEYNFSNLVFAYTGSTRYKSLQSILSNFVSEVQWWHGSPTCKESIKWAMKTAAMRAVAHPKETNEHKDALYQLDEALIHVKNCRSTKDDRRDVAEAFIRVVRHPAAAQERASQKEVRDAIGISLERRETEKVETAQKFHKLLAGHQQVLAAAAEA